MYFFHASLWSGELYCLDQIPPGLAPEGVLEFPITGELLYFWLCFYLYEETYHKSMTITSLRSLWEPYRDNRQTNWSQLIIFIDLQSGNRPKEIVKKTLTEAKLNMLVPMDMPISLLLVVVCINWECNHIFTHSVPLEQLTAAPYKVVNEWNGVNVMSHSAEDHNIFSSTPQEERSTNLSVVIKSTFDH